MWCLPNNCNLTHITVNKTKQKTYLMWHSSMEILHSSTDILHVKRVPTRLLMKSYWLQNNKHSLLSINEHRMSKWWGKQRICWKFNWKSEDKAFWSWDLEPLCLAPLWSMIIMEGPTSTLFNWTHNCWSLKFKAIFQISSLLIGKLFSD